MNFKSWLLAPLLSLGFLTATHAAALTNNIVGVGPKNALVGPYFCIQNSAGTVVYSLAAGQTVNDVTKYTDPGHPENPNPYVGGTLRFGGCTTNDFYLGYVDLFISDAKKTFGTYTPPQGSHITYINGAIDVTGSLTGSIQYTAINSNYNLLTTAPATNKDWSFVGINLSGLEFSKMINPGVIPNLSQEDVSVNDGKSTDLPDTQAFLKAGMNTVRVPVRWGYLQLDGPGVGEINLDYYNSYVKPLLETLTSAGVNTIVDLHSYMHYAVFGKQYAGCGNDGACPDGILITDPNAYQDVWTKLYTLMKNDPHINMDHILLDLINEPVNAPNDSVFTVQAQVIKSLRQQGYQGYILVEGNSWSGLHSWISNTWTSGDGKTTYSNATLFSRDNFTKAGITDLNKIVINAHQYLDSDYSGTQTSCQTDLSTTGPNGFNLNAFADYLKQNHLKAMLTEFGSGQDSGTCATALNALIAYLQANAAKDKDYGFIGWTIWSTGHGWDGYPLRVTPTSYQMAVLQNYLQGI